jgi:hypothetical protein
VRRARRISFALLSVLGVAVVGAGMAWACTPPDFGTPASPPPPPPPSGSSSGAPTSSVDGTAAAAPPSPQGPVSVDQSTGSSLTTSGAISTSTHADASPGTRVRRASPSPFTAREKGATAGLERQGDQLVFSKSTSSSAKPGSNASRAKQLARSERASVSGRSATADLWSGLARPTMPSMSAAEVEAARRSGGVGGGVVLGFAIVGFGLVGLTASVLFSTRRRAAS